MTLFINYFSTMNYRESEYFSKNGIVIEKVLARGNNGLVYLVTSTHDKNQYALKKYPHHLFNNADLDSLIAINNPYFVHLHQYYKFDSSVYLLMEYCPSNLEKLILETDNVTENMLKDYIRQVVNAVKACHDNNIYIGDFTLSNFLIDNHGSIKINFLGLKHIVNAPNDNLPMNMISTNFFLPPELLENQNVSPMYSDIWSLGCIIYFMATKTLPFSSKDMKSLKTHIKEGHYNKFLIEDEDLRDVISKCLNVQPNNRLPVSNLLRLKYFGVFERRNNQKSMLKSDWRKSVMVVRRNMTFISKYTSNIDIPFTPTRAVGDFR